MIDNPFIYATTTVAGIDYSLRCPAICVIPPTDINNTVIPFENCHFYYLTTVQKDAIDQENIHGSVLGVYSSDEERYESIADWAVEVLKKHQCQCVGIEGYAYNASNTSSLTQLAENQGLLKYKLFQNNIAYDIFAPSAIKKFATSKGNANKDLMFDAWLNDTGVDLQSVFSRDADGKIRSPVSDIVDAYYIALSERVDTVATNYIYEEGENNVDI